MTFVRALAAALAVGLLAPPAIAAPADPGQSAVWVQVPGLAPGVVGSAPLYGEMGRDGRFVLHAPVSQARTGDAMQESILRRFVPGTVSLSGDAPVRVRALKNGQTLRMTGTVRAAGTSMTVPLFVRLSKRGSGTAMRTFFKLPLSAYGVRKLGGGSAGDVRVAIEAVFPD